MIKKLDRRLGFGLIAVAAIVALTLFIAPRSNQLTSGSTYNRAPDGYGAWYAFMQKQGTPVERWRKSAFEADQIKGTGNTMIQIDPTNTRAYDQEDWVKRGNTWIIVGRDLPVTEAEFSTQHQSDRGLVKIDTARRFLKSGATELLGDQFGSIVWQEKKGKGRVIYVGTPFLAANAYQDEPGNFPFLAQLATQSGKKIWVDEYIHGYRDQTEETATARTRNWGDYLLGTPLAVVFLQTIVVSLVLIWAKNRRFGQPKPLETPKTNDSQAYTQALAGVLYKAGRSEFVVDVVGREEQLQIQRSLGIGGRLLDREALRSAWVAQTGRSASELEPLFLQKRLNEQDLLKWLDQVQAIKQHLPG